MFDALAIISLIVGGALATEHFGLGLPFLIVGGLLLLKDSKGTSKYMEIMGPLAMIAVVVTFVIALFVNYA